MEDERTLGDIEVSKFSTKDKNFDFDKLFWTLNTVSLFESRKFIILEIYDKDMNTSKEAQLNELLTGNLEHVCFIVVFDKKPLVKSILKKTLESVSRIHKVEALSQMQRSSYIISKLKELGIRLSAEVNQELEQRVGQDLVRLDNEIKKLSVLDREITIKDIELLVSKDLDDNIFALSDALLKKNLKQVLNVYQGLLQLKIDPLALFGMLAASIRRNYQVNSLMSMNMRQEDVASQLGMSDKQVYFIYRNQRMDPVNSLRLLNILATREQEAKSGKIDRFIALELFLIDATTS